LKIYCLPNFRLFDGEGGGAPAGDGGNAAPATAQAQPQEIVEKAPEVDVTSDAKEARRAEFEQLIKGQYREEYNERAQKMIDSRFKQVKALEEQANRVKDLEPVLELLGSKYGVDGTDVNKLIKAIQEDDSYYQEEAMQKGMSVEALKHIKEIERENAQFKRAQQEMEQRRHQEQIQADWMRQGDALKQVYPNFDLRTECGDPDTGARFVDLLANGIDVRTAYEVIHKDDLIGSAMQYTAQAIQQKTVNDIRARGMRPPENGGNSSAATTQKIDPGKLTKKERDALARRAMRGERIVL